MNWLDFTMTVSTNLSNVGFWLACVSTCILVIVTVTALIQGDEYSGIEFLSTFKTLCVLTSVLWIFAVLPSVKDVKKLKEDIQSMEAAVAPTPSATFPPHNFHKKGGVK